MVGPEHAVVARRRNAEVEDESPRSIRQEPARAPAARRQDRENSTKKTRRERPRCSSRRSLVEEQCRTRPEVQLGEQEGWPLEEPPSRVRRRREQRRVVQREVAEELATCASRPVPTSDRRQKSAEHRDRRDRCEFRPIAIASMPPVIATSPRTSRSAKTDGSSCPRPRARDTESRHPARSGRRQNRHSPSDEIGAAPTSATPSSRPSATCPRGPIQSLSIAYFRKYATPTATAIRPMRLSQRPAIGAPSRSRSGTVVRGRRCDGSGGEGAAEARAAAAGSATARARSRQGAAVRQLPPRSGRGWRLRPVCRAEASVA